LNEQIETSHMGTLIVSHYDRFYQIVQPTHAHVLIEGKIVISGGRELATKVDEQGYDWLQKELGIEIKDEKTAVVRNAIGSLGTCAVKELSDVAE
jgi:Fe-S cluster assembly ATP-binding protein